MNNDNENKKVIIKRNMIASLVGIIFVFIVISVAPLYEIMSDMQVTEIDLTMTQINQRYLYIVSIILFFTFLVGFYLTKAIFNFIMMKKRKKTK